MHTHAAATAEGGPVVPVKGDPRAARPAMVTPVADALIGGGASIVVLLAMMALGLRPGATMDYGVLIAFGILLNWPHFIASYFLLYADPESLSRYRWVSVWVPAVLFAYGIFSLFVSSTQPVHYNLLTVFAGLYLARHYTGQTWGVMASFAHIDNAGFQPRERQLIRTGLNLLMVWHVLWALDQSLVRVWPGGKVWAAEAYARGHWVALAGLLCGVVGLVSQARRLRRPPPLRVVLPWVALHVWYVALYWEAGLLLVVQVAHALQYLLFPIRAQLNSAPAAPRGAWRGLLHMGLWFLVGLAVFEGIEPIFGATFRIAGGHGELPALVAPVLITCIGVHHYFIDGALYKLRNPRVRTLLFSHLRR